MARANRLAFLAFLVLFFASFAAAQSYTITNLGPSQVVAVNNLGDVLAQGVNGSFIWFPDGSHLALDPLPGDTYTTPRSINSKGLAVGDSDNGQGTSAVLWTNGEPLDLGTLPGGSSSSGTGINASVQVAGYCFIPTGVEAFLWTKATGMQGLGFLPGAKFSVAKAINRFGQVAGYSGASSDFEKDYAFIWSKTTGMKNLGKLPGYDGSAAYAINDLGEAAGASTCRNQFVCPPHAVLWSKTKGSMLDLGVLSGNSYPFSFALGMNNVGQVVGWSQYSAFVWSPSTGMLDLNNLIPANSGWFLISARAINDKGQIVGEAILNNQYEYFLLTPQ